MPDEHSNTIVGNGPQWNPDGVEDLRKNWNDHAEEWLKIAQDEQDPYTLRGQWIAKLICRHVPKGSNLDIGCAGAPLSWELLKLGHDIYGADFEGSIELARKRFSGMVDNVEQRFRPLMEGGKIPFEGMQFDTVSAIDVLPCIEVHLPYIKLLMQFVKPDGYLVISNVNRVSIHVYSSIFNTLTHWRTIPHWKKMAVNLYRTGWWSGGFIRYMPDVQAHSAAQLDRICRQAGLELVDELNHHHIRKLDRSALDRSPIGKWVARQFARTHVGLYRRTR
jgi:2-polyprenyl-3-methyl-5-hydroxy-6-metoxy-1,4-benzoquinol methylase